MKNMLCKILLSMTILMPVIVSAHPGHDHLSSSAVWLHLLWIAPLLLVLVGVIYQKKSKSSQ